MNLQRSDNFSGTYFFRSIKNGRITIWILQVVDNEMLFSKNDLLENNNFESKKNKSRIEKGKPLDHNAGLTKVSAHGKKSSEENHLL